MEDPVNENRYGTTPKRAVSRRLDLTPAEQVAVAGALRRDLELPDTDHQRLRELLARLTS
jgi:hypothetical protein